MGKIKGLTKLKGKIFYADKGDKFPLILSLDTDIVDFDRKKINLVLKKKLYIMFKFSKSLTEEQFAKLKLKQQGQVIVKGIYFSLDAKNWASIIDLKAVKEILGIKGGYFFFGFSISTKKGLEGRLKMETKKSDK